MWEFIYYLIFIFNLFNKYGLCCMIIYLLLNEKDSVMIIIIWIVLLYAIVYLTLVQKVYAIWLAKYFEFYL